MVCSLSLFFSAASGVLGAFIFGYNTGVINAPQSVIEGFINSTRNATDPNDSGDFVKLMWSLIVSAFAVGGMFGGFIAGWWAEFFGRKNGLWLNTIIATLAGALFLIAPLINSYEVLIIGRVVVGFSCGLYTGIVPVYLTEISHKSYRGVLGITNQLGVVLGILISQVLGLDFLLSTTSLWHVLLALTAAPAVIQALLLFFSTESPRYLYIIKNETTQAQAVLGRLRAVSMHRESIASEALHTEIDELRLEAAAVRSVQRVGLCALIVSGKYVRPLLVSTLMHLSQQLSGINVIFYYSKTLFEQCGLTPKAAGYATIGVGGIMVALTFVSVPLIERLGRRTLHLGGLAGMLACGVAFTICFSLRSKAAALPYVCTALCLLFVVFFAVGPGSIPWMIVSELFSQGARPAAVSVATLINWAANFVVGLTFPFLLSGLADCVFVPFSVLTAVFLAALALLLPETKGCSFEEIQQLLRRPLLGGGGLAQPKRSYRVDAGADALTASTIPLAANTAPAHPT